MGAHGGNGSSVKLALQAIALRQFYPGSAIRLSTRGLAWHGAVVPSPTSRSYRLGLIARDERTRPDVYVTAPQLQPDCSGRLPHVWDDGSLCLCARGEWRPNDLYVDTVIPWASEWLFFYEIWKATAIWMGDEVGAAEKQTESVLYRFADWGGDRREVESAEHNVAKEKAT